MNINTLVNIVIYTFMVGAILAGALYVECRLFSFGRSFREMRKMLEDKDNVEAQREYLYGVSDAASVQFGDPLLRSRYEEYRADLLRQRKKAAEAEDISIRDYLNVAFLNESCNIRLSDLIPGTMTGLGILGTFVGLVLGIGRFDTTSAEALTNSITGLLSGMKTAFYTSIIGVFSSLIYSHVHRRVYQCTLQEMENFISAFCECGLESTENTAENQILREERRQSELLETLPDVVATAITKAIDSSFQGGLLPVFSRMEQTIETFGEFASRQQQNGLEQVVQEFVKCMNESLKGQFEELGSTIQSLCMWQKSSVEQMQKIVDGICNTSNEIEKINAISKETITEMNQFVSLLSQLQGTIYNETEQVRQQIEQGTQISKEQSAYIEKIVGYEGRIAQLSDHIKDEADTAKTVLENMDTHCHDQLQGITEAAKKNMEMLSDATKVLVESSHQQLEALVNSASDDMEMLANTAAQLSDDNHQQLNALTKTAAEQLTQLSKTTDAVLQNSQQQISAAITATQAQSDALKQTSKDFVEFVQKEQTALSDAVKAEMGQLNGFAVQTTAGLQQASDSIESAAKTLDQNLEQSLGRTFNVFDQNLADITQHLSGTIADVRDTTEMLPRVMLDAQKQYKNVLDGLSGQTQSYMKELQQLTEEIKKRNAHKGANA